MAQLTGTRQEFKISLFWDRFYEIVGLCIGVCKQVFTDFPEGWEPLPNSRRQRGDEKQDPT